MSRLLIISVLLLAGLVGASFLLRADEKPATAAANGEAGKEKPKPFDFDRQLLVEAGIGTDGKALLEYLRKLSPKELEPVDFPALVEQLGDKTFEKREEASKKLAAFDLVPSGLLIDAIYGPDKEMVRRAQVLADKQAKNSNWFLPLPAVRQLVKEKPAGTLEVLLRYLPFATWEDLIEEIWYAIDSLAVQNGKVDDRLLLALHDRSPARRAVSGCIIGRVGNAAQKAELVKMLDDSDGMVRLRVAQGFLASGDERGIPTLVSLLNHKSMEISWQAEELLHWFAGDGAPKETVGAGTENERKKCTVAWKGWLASYPANEKDAQAQSRYRRPGLLLIREKNGPDSRIWLCGCDGGARWNLKLQDALASQFVSANHLLVARRFHWQEKPIDWFPREKLELVDFLGSVHYQKKLNGALYFHEFPNASLAVDECETIVILSGIEREITRLPLGRWGSPHNTRCFGTYGNSVFFALESDRTGIGNRVNLMDLQTGKLIDTFAIPEGKVFSLNAITSGTLLIRFGPSGKVRQFELDGKEIPWHFPVTSICSPVKLVNGDLLLAANSTPHGRIFAQDDSGKVFWETFTVCQDIEQIATCYRLVSFGFSTLKRDLDCVAYRLAVLKGREKLINTSSLARDYSFEFLGQLGNQAKDAIPVLVEKIRNPADELRQDASSTLVRIGPIATAKVSELLSSKDANVKIAATRILAEYCMQEGRLLPAMRKAGEDKDPSVRAAFYEGLGRLNGQAEDLLNLLRAGLEDTNILVQKKSIEAIEKKQGAAKTLVPKLVQILKGPQKELHQGAARALGTIAPDDKGTVKALLDALQNESSAGSQIGAAEAFAKIGPSAEEAIPILLQIARKPANKNPPEIGVIERTALYALSGMGAKAQAILPRLIEILKDQSYSEDDRIHACVWMREIGVPRKEAIIALQDIERNQHEPESLRFNAKVSLAVLRKGN
jgi:HEAT repeat protein